MKTLLRIITIIAFLGFLVPTFMFAQSLSLPNQFFGTVTLSEGATTDGLIVEAKVNGVVIGTSVTNNGKYGYNPNLLFALDNEGIYTGQTVHFYVSGIEANETITFSNGASTNLNLTIVVPNDTVTSDGTDVSLSSTIAGEVDMPIGATNIVLTNTTVMDLSIGLSGDAVTLNSGVSSMPIVLANSNLGGINASIPDGTKIQGPSGWNGKITPPISGTPSGGNAPAGFSVGGTVISIGSPDGTLIFDKPVTILLTGVTGTVGYRPSGSNTWVQITNVCGGSYILPTSPMAPGECTISNGADTKIVTYHFTSFGSLTANLAPSITPTSSGGGGGGVTTPLLVSIKGDINNDSKVDKYDFALIMANWGKTGSNNSDLNGDSKVDKYDFSLLMLNWSK